MVDRHPTSAPVWRRALAVVCAAGLVLAGCGSDDSGDGQDGSADNSDGSALADRDDAAVYTAIRTVDLCAMLKSATDDVSDVPDDTEITTDGPFGCTIRMRSENGNDAQADDKLSVRITESVPVGAPREFGGVLVHVDDTMSTGCAMLAPIDTNLMIMFTMMVGAATPGDAACQLTKDVTKAAITSLSDDPTRFEREPMWDPCTALTAAAGPDAGTQDLIAGDFNLLSVCFTDTDPMEVTPASGVQLNFDPDFALAGTDEHTETTMHGTTVWVRTGPDDDEQEHEHDHHDVFPGTCRVTWYQPGSTSRHASEDEYPVMVTTPDCEQSEQVTGSLMEVLAQPPPTDVAPQEPLLYPA